MRQDGRVPLLDEAGPGAVPGERPSLDGHRPVQAGQDIQLMSMLSQHDLISALTALPERELAGVVAVALEKRDSGVGRRESRQARLHLAEALGFIDARSTPSPRQLPGPARPQMAGDVVAKGAARTEQAGCCGLTFTSHAKRIICPLCGKPASAS